MATLTYSRSWSRDQEREAKIFIRTHYERPTPTGLGCGDVTTVPLVQSSLDASDMFVMAHDGDVLVAVYAVTDQNLRPGPEFVHYDPTKRWVVTAVAALPNYDVNDILWNMGVAMCELLFDREGDGWMSWTSPELIDACRALPWCDWDRPATFPPGWYEIGGVARMTLPDGTPSPLQAYTDVKLV